MKIIIAPDAFKGSLTARQASEAIAEGVYSVVSDVEPMLYPLADGGEGTADVLINYLDGKEYLVESAALIGLNLPDMYAQPVENRGSSSVGSSILNALDRGERRFIVALGGSATNDAGIGMLIALGMKAWDNKGELIEPSLSGLMKLNRIDISNMDGRLAQCSFTVLADVMSPLCGKKGATAIYGPQKGVETSKVNHIDDAIARFIDMCMDVFGSNPSSKYGAGAAGGLGYALMLLGGEVVSGADYLIKATGLLDALSDADWVITGEGCSDIQTLQGKLPARVALAARAAGVKVALLSGSVDQEAFPELEKEFDLIISAKPESMSREQAMREAEALLIEAAAFLARRINCEY